MNPAAMPRSTRRARGRAWLAALALLAAACGTKDNDSPFQPTEGFGRIRFVNVITDTTRGRVNAILEGVPFGVNLTYTQATPATLPAPSTANYAPIYAGARALVLRRTADTSVTVATFTVNVTESQDRTVYAIGGAAASAVSAFETADTNSAVTATQVRLRVVHLSPTVGAVDVFVTAVNADLAAATPAVAGLAYRATSPYLTIAPGTYQIRAVPAGTLPAARAANVRINVASTAFAGAVGRTIVAADNNVGGAPFRAFILTDQ